MHLSSALLVILPTLALAAPTQTNPLNPTRPFRVQAYQSPQPVGSGLSGLTLVADAGDLWLTNDKTAISKSAVTLAVDNQGHASLSKPVTAKVFLETYDGHLAYYGPNFQPPSAPSTVNFLHLGPTSGAKKVSPPDAEFNWIGSSNNYWFACQGGRRPPGWYRVVKVMAGAGSNVNGCQAVQLAALDP